MKKYLLFLVSLLFYACHSEVADTSKVLNGINSANNEEAKDHQDNLEPNAYPAVYTTEAASTAYTLLNDEVLIKRIEWKLNLLSTSTEDLQKNQLERDLDNFFTEDCIVEISGRSTLKDINTYLKTVKFLKKKISVSEIYGSREKINKIRVAHK